MTRLWTLVLLPSLAACFHGPRAEGASDAPSNGEFAVVGTIHKGHLSQVRYPLGVLCRIVADYRPDLVLVEIRPEAFARARYEDGPFEMTYVIGCARSRRIPVEPIDWWREEDVEAPEPVLTSEEEGAFHVEEATLPEPTWPSFRAANAPVERQRSRRLLNLRARYFAGDAIWTRRQAWFDHLALRAVERHQARRVLAFVGYNHASALESYLQSFGLRARNPLAIVSSLQVDSNDRAPQAVVAMWRDGLARLREQVQSASGELARRLSTKVRIFELAVERAGTCCVATP